MKVLTLFAHALVPVLLLGVAGTTAPPASAATSARTGSTVSAASTVPTVLESMSLATTATALTGAQLTTMTVSMHLVDPDGVVPRGGSLADRGWNCPCVWLESLTSAGANFRASPQATGGRLVSLTLTSGTATDGVWVGRTILGAGDAGIWRPTSLDAGDFVSTSQEPYASSFVAVPADITTATALNLRGYDWPLLTVRIPSAVTVVGQRFVITGTAMSSRTHRPVAGLRVVLGAGLMCSPLDHCVGTAVRTSSTGAFALSSTDFHRFWSALWAQDAQGFPVNFVQAQRMHVRYAVSLGAIRTSAKAGSSLSVFGHVTPWVDDLGAARLVLQRFYSGTWHNVGTTSAYPGGYTLKAYPPRGSWQYRVRVVTGYDCIGTYSRTFSLRGV